jgi:hypothetical protein
MTGRSSGSVAEKDWWRYRQGHRRLEGTQGDGAAQDPEQAGWGKIIYFL